MGGGGRGRKTIKRKSESLKLDIDDERETFLTVERRGVERAHF